MDIQVNEKEYCKLEVKYTADADQIDNKKTEVLSIFKKAPVPGFRAGKANLEVIKVHYKKQIEDSLKQALAEEAFHNTMFENNIKPLGQPSFTSVNFKGNKFECEFTVNKKPDFELAQYTGFEIPKPARAFTNEEVIEKMLEELRVQHGEMLPFTDTDFVSVGDKIIVSYVGSIDGVPVEAISTEGELLTVGSNPLKDFDNALLGMSVGETREFDIVIPDNGLPSYKGKTIHFSVTVSMGSKIEKVPLDDSLAQKLGKETFQELREYVVSLANGRLNENDRAALVAQVTARLVAEHDVKVPEWLSLSEAQYLAINSKKDWETLPDEDKETFLKLASDNVKLALILDRIRDKEPEAQLSDQEIVEMIRQNIAKSSPNTDEVLQNMNKSGYLPVLVARLRDEHTLDFILKNTTVTE